MTIKAEERICPLCGEDNNCQHNKDCWCFQVPIPAYIVEMIPETERGKSCICKSCIEKYTKEELI